MSFGMYCDPFCAALEAQQPGVQHFITGLWLFLFPDHSIRTLTDFLVLEHRNYMAEQSVKNFVPFFPLSLYDSNIPKMNH